MSSGDDTRDPPPAPPNRDGRDEESWEEAVPPRGEGEGADASSGADRPDDGVPTWDLGEGLEDIPEDFRIEPAGGSQNADLGEAATPNSDAERDTDGPKTWDLDGDAEEELIDLDALRARAEALAGWDQAPDEHAPQAIDEVRGEALADEPPAAGDPDSSSLSDEEPLQEAGHKPSDGGDADFEMPVLGGAAPEEPESYRPRAFQPTAYPSEEDQSHAPAEEDLLEPDGAFEMPVIGGAKPVAASEDEDLGEPSDAVVAGEETGIAPHEAPEGITPGSAGSHSPSETQATDEEAGAPEGDEVADEVLDDGQRVLPSRRAGLAPPPEPSEYGQAPLSGPPSDGSTDAAPSESAGATGASESESEEEAVEGPALAVETSTAESEAERASTSDPPDQESEEDDAPSQSDGGDSSDGSPPPVRPSQRAPRTKAPRLPRREGWSIAMTRDAVRSFHVRTDGDHIRIERGPSCELVSGGAEAGVTETVLQDNASDSLREVLDALPRRAGRIRMLLDDPWLVSRFLHMPLVKRRRQLDILVQQRAAGEGFDRYGFLQGGDSWQEGQQGQAIYAAMTRGKLLDRLERTFIRARRRADRFWARPSGGVLWPQLGASSAIAKQRHLVMELFGGRLRIDLCDGGRVLYARAVELGAQRNAEELATLCVTELQRTSIFMASRLRTSQVAEALIVSDRQEVADAMQATLTEQFDLDFRVIDPRVKLIGFENPEVRSIAVDAALLVLSPSATLVGTVAQRSPLAAERRRIRIQIPPALTAGAAILTATWLWHTQQVADADQARAIATALEAPARTAAQHMEARAAIETERKAFAAEVTALETALRNPRNTTRRLGDIFRRIGPELIVDVIYESPYQVKSGLDNSVPPETVVPGKLLLDGVAWYGLFAAETLLNEQMSRLLESPYVSAIRDLSPFFDPMEATEGTKVRPYPVRLELTLTNPEPRSP